MRYYSTRGKSDHVTASEAIIRGLAPDGGLYVPAGETASLTFDELPAGDYRALAAYILALFQDDFTEDEIETAVFSAYNSKSFDHPGITPLYRLTDQIFFLELWHGPTSAFKDIALQLMPHLMRAALRKKEKETEMVILTATSGDTGKSALEGFRDIPGMKIIVYFPEGGVSEIQKLQMTTQEGGNVCVTAVKGNFDDAQRGVKQIFSDRNLARLLAKNGFRLSSANSINWGRLVPQIVYYFAAYRDLVEGEALGPGDKINFVVPTGNFGNILAGYYAGRLGLPVNRLICAANKNSVVADFINTGAYDSRRPFYRTLSPSMDILVSSNLERLLFELTDHDSELINEWMRQLRESGAYRIDAPTLQKLQDLFWADYADDEDTLQTIAATYRDTGYLIDTHTAVGKAVYEKYRDREQDRSHTVIMSTASPFKFTGSVAKAVLDSNRYGDKSELDLLAVLAREAGSNIPSNLVGLAQKEVVHRQVIAPEEMRDHLLKALSLD